MTTFKRKPMTSLLAVLLFTLASGGAAMAQSTTPTDSADSMSAMHSGQNDTSSMHKSMMGMHKNMMGMHMMPATVNSVDTKTGQVDVTAEGMMLKVHFPASAVANLKAGDKITLHMGYSKP